MSPYRDDTDWQDSLLLKNEDREIVRSKAGIFTRVCGKWRKEKSSEKILGEAHLPHNF